MLTLFLLRHDNVQDVAGELFGCSQSTVSRNFRKVGPLLEQATAAVAAQAVQRARLGAVLLDGFVAPTGERGDQTDLFSGKHRLSGMNVQVIADLDGRVVDTGTRSAPQRHLDISLRVSTTVGAGDHQDLPDATTLTGSPETIAARIDEYRTGVDEFVLDFTASDRSEHVEQQRRFADTVLPLLATGR